MELEARIEKLQQNTKALLVRLDKFNSCHSAATGEFCSTGSGGGGGSSTVSHPFTEAKTFSGWQRTYHIDSGDVQVSRYKPITRGAYTSYKVSGGGKEKSFSLQGVDPTSVEGRISRYLDKTYGIKDSAPMRMVRE